MTAFDRDGGAAVLRQAFDGAFAEAAAACNARTEDLLAFRVAGEPYALRLAAVAGLSTDRRIAAFPGVPGVPGLLGLAGVRGGLVAVYGLRALLGLPPGPSPRWIARLRCERAVGLAFDELDGYLRLAPGEVAPAAGPAGEGCHVREVARAGDVLRPILDEASILATIKTLLRAAGVREEPER